MKKSAVCKKKSPKPGSLTYYIEAVVGYRAEYETAENFKEGYPPVVAELLLSLLISVRAIRHSFSFLVGALIALMVKLLLMGG